LEKPGLMKYLVIYYSKTGNTRKVAGAIYDALPGEKRIKPMNEIHTPEENDLMFIGFPIMQFGPPARASQFISRHAAGKKIALFVTHAMPCMSDDPNQEAMLEKELNRCRAACSKSQLLGLFHCQGELSEDIARELIASGNPLLMEFAGMRPLTIGHPDPEELEQARIFAVGTITP